METKIKVFVVDDHELFRNGVIMVLNRIENTVVVGEAADGEEFLAKLNSIKPDIVFMDIKMPKMNGIDATIEALRRYPELKVIALTMFGEEEYLQKMINAGGYGFLLKNSSIDEIERAVNLVSQGKNCYSDELLSYFTKKYIKKASLEEEDVRLTRRELEVLDLVAKGFSNQEIADKLFISRRTVDGHKANLIQKTGSKNIVDLLVYAIKKGLVSI
jgi:DNA-binding NarL/FixJ family response regulator